MARPGWNFSTKAVVPDKKEDKVGGKKQRRHSVHDTDGLRRSV